MTRRVLGGRLLDGPVGGFADETGTLCVTFLEGMRRSWDVRRWWGEYVEQCWFIAKVTSLPVILVAIPLGSTISLQVGEIRRSSAAARCRVATVLAARSTDSAG